MSTPRAPLSAGVPQPRWPPCSSLLLPPGQICPSLKARLNLHLLQEVSPELLDGQ